jgi:GTP-binding protein
VGKSTLFNRISGERKAIVDDLPGVTRDCNYAEAEWLDRRFVIVDTGGLDGAAEGDLARGIQKQSRRAVTEADAVVFLLDGKEGLNPLDGEGVELLRKANKPVFFAVNKIDSRRRAETLYEFHSLGLDALYPISAEHGLGIAALLDDVVAAFPKNGESELAPRDQPALSIAVVGRPNVGKSTLVNRLLGFERSVVDPRPGTTRDSLDTPFELNSEPCILVDTAGVRRKARIDDRIERYSVKRSLRAVDRGDLIIHLIDGPEGVTDQDAQILSYGVERGKALLLAVNKWDLISQAGGDAESYRREVYRRLSFLNFVPVVFIAATTGYGVRKMLEAAGHIIEVYRRRVPTSLFNQTLQQIVRAHPAPLWQGKTLKIYYGTQTGVGPPTFTLFVNRPRNLPEDYRRYLVQQLRLRLGLETAPIKLILRPRRAERERG